MGGGRVYRRRGEEKEKAHGYFDIWFPYGGEFLIDAKNGYERGSLKKAAFELHQAAECFYNTALLVFTGYKPKTEVAQLCEAHFAGVIYHFPHAHIG